MERFAIKLHRAELDVLIDRIESYDIKPVFISNDGGISFHPWTRDDQKMVIVFDWKYMVPLTVYNIKWFHKESDTHWCPITTRKPKAKHRRIRDKLRSK